MVPVEVHGVSYQSVSEAARALGVSDGAIHAARRNGTLHRVGCGRPGVEPLPVRIDGTVYASAEAASHALGINRMTIYAAVADGDPDRVVRAKRYNPWRAQPFTIGGLSFSSMRQASISLGFKNPEFISKVIKKGSKRGWEKVVAAAMREEAKRAAGMRRMAV